MQGNVLRVKCNGWAITSMENRHKNVAGNFPCMILHSIIVVLLLCIIAGNISLLAVPIGDDIRGTLTLQ